jgi:uncharacterized protein YndB with AHSA1/START domain
MITTERKVITTEVKIQAPVDKVWSYWTSPQHIVKWNYASDDWHTPRAENDVRPGGKFLWRMEAKDGSFGFDFNGVYTKVEPFKLLEYTLGDDRKVLVQFQDKGQETVVTEKFEAEEINSIEMQELGWQSILNNFKKHVEKPDIMEQLHFELYINAPADKVFETMLGEKTFNEWTKAFNPGSHYKGSWEKGSEIRFLGTDEQGAMGGMVSRIKENIPNKFVSIEHYGVIQNGEEITSGPEVEKWTGLENYTFTDVNCHTMLAIDVDTNKEFRSYFEETWPQALKRLKEICEER